MTEGPWEGWDEAASAADLEEVRRVVPGDLPVAGPDPSYTGQGVALPGDEPAHLPAGPFEPYLVRYTSDELTAAEVFVNYGRIYTDPDDLTAVAAVTGIDDVVAVEAGTKCWIETDFAADGSVNSCELASGASWPLGGAFYQDNSPDGNLWITPIFELVAPRTGKSGGDHPDRGWFRDLDGPAMHLDRLTWTHLRAEQRCINDTEMWVLVPA